MMKHQILSQDLSRLAEIIRKTEQCWAEYRQSLDKWDGSNAFQIQHTERPPNIAAAPGFQLGHMFSSFEAPVGGAAWDQADPHIKTVYEQRPPGVMGTGHPHFEYDPGENTAYRVALRSMRSVRCACDRDAARCRRPGIRA